MLHMPHWPRLTSPLLQERVRADRVEGDHAAENDAVAHSLSEADVRLLNWHWANLEYGCSSRLSDVSLAHWNQVDAALAVLEVRSYATMLPDAFVPNASQPEHYLLLLPGSCCICLVQLQAP